MEKQPQNRARRWSNYAMRFAQELLDRLFLPDAGWLSRLLVWAFVALLLVYGIRQWGVFYSWGNISFDFLDWGEVTGPRYALLRDAATRGILPLHAGNLTALRGVTDRYFSIADTPFSPQYLLLPLISTGRYIFYDTLLFYCLGFIGLLLIYRKYRLSPFTFLLLFLLMNFNGDITGHLAVGHANWTAHFLIPYFVLLVMHLVEKEQVGWKWQLGMIVLMLVILMQGGFHLFLWCLMFLALLPLMNWRLWKPVLLAGVFTVLVCSWRLLPPALALAGVSNEFLGGFPSVTDLIGSMIVLYDPTRTLQPITDTFRLNFWEIDFYIGFLGFALLAIFGVILPLRRSLERKSVQMQLLVPSLVMAAFSVGQVYAKVISIVRIPPFTGERVTSRMFILPLMVVLVLAVITLQRELERRKLEQRPIPAWIQLVGLGLAYLLFHDLNQHMQAWRIRYLDAMVHIFPKMPFDPLQHTIQNHPDPIYTGMLLGGSIVGLLALGFMIFMAARENRRKPKAEMAPTP